MTAPSAAASTDPRVVLRAIVSTHTQAAVAPQATPAQAWAHEHAAALLARCDPRAWGGAHGLPDDEVRDLILASIDRAATAAHALDSAVAALIDTARTAVATTGATTTPLKGLVP